MNGQNSIKTGNTMSKRQLASMIDHTLLKPDATEDQIKKLCREAAEYGFASVCINPCYVPLAAAELKDTEVRVCTVIGFPLGAATAAVKAAEACDAVNNGADEVDMVLNIGAIKSGRQKDAEDDIRQVVGAVAGKALVKVILETCLLNDEEKVAACRLAAKAGADFVKTSTGFSTGGAAVEDIRLMRETVGPAIGVKASGGVRDYSTAVAMIEAGATRIGTSSSIAIVEGVK